MFRERELRIGAELTQAYKLFVVCCTRRVVAEWLRLLPLVSKVAGSIPVCVPRSDVALLV